MVKLQFFLANSIFTPIFKFLVRTLKGQLVFRELDVLPGKTEVKVGNFIEFICIYEGLF